MGQDLKFTNNFRPPDYPVINSYRQLNIWRDLFGDNLYVFNYHDTANFESRILGHFSLQVKSLLIENYQKKEDISLNLKKDENTAFSKEHLMAIYRYRENYNLSNNVRNRALQESTKIIIDEAKLANYKIEYK